MSTTTTQLDWTPSELDWLLSRTDSELEAWLNELPLMERESLMDRLWQHTEKRKESESGNRSGSRENGGRENDDQDSDWVSSKGKLAPRIGMSLPMLERYIAKGAKIEGPPYSVSKSMAEVERVRNEDAGGNDSVGIGLRRERLVAEVSEQIQAARSRKLKNDILEGKLYNADEVDQYLAATASQVKARLEQIPDEAVLEVPVEWRDRIRQILGRMIHSVLLELSGKRFDPSGQAPSDDDVTPET